MNKQQIQTNIGFIGGGNMAQAIIRGLLSAGHDAGHIHVADPAETQQQAIRNLSTKIKITKDNRQIAGTCNVLVLAVKPQIMASVAETLADSKLAANQVILSIAAGITLGSLQSWLGKDAALVRVMPNTPALIGAGISGLCANANVDKRGRQLADYVMTATGEAIWLEDEKLMDVVTAISGSGPAYFFLFMEIMQDVAIELGFDKETARLLSSQTALGAGLVAGEADESLATLRSRVTSPGGTTEAALKSLERDNIRAIFRSALLAARDKSIELGQPKS